MLPSIPKWTWVCRRAVNRIAHTPSQKPRTDVFRHRNPGTEKGVSQRSTMKPRVGQVWYYSISPFRESLLLSSSRGGSFASRFGFSRLFELSTPCFSSRSGKFLCVVSGVHATGPRCSFVFPISGIRPFVRAARGAKAEAEGKSYSRSKQERFLTQQRRYRTSADQGLRVPRFFPQEHHPTTHQ